MTAINTWIVHNYEYTIRRSVPTAQNIFNEPYVWINPVTEKAYVLYGGSWFSKTPDRTIVTDSGYIYVIEDIEDIIGEYVTIQGDRVTIGGEMATW